MASGKSQRFGRDKLTFPLEGIPVLSRTLETVLTVRRAISEEISLLKPLVVPRWQGVEDLCQAINEKGNRYVDRGVDREQDEVLCIRHQSPFRSDTIKEGLRFLRGQGFDENFDHAGILFLVGDQPLLSVGSLQRLVETFSQDSEKICRISYQGCPGNPVLFPWRFFGELMELEGDQGGGKVLKRHRQELKLVEADREEELFDLDTPEDLIRIQEILNKNQIYSN